MRLSEKIVLRKGVDGFLLFAPDTGKAFSLNSTSAIIAEELKGECSSEEILKVLCRRFPEGDPAGMEHDLQEFLGQLKSLGYLEGFSGEAVALSESSNGVGNDGRHETGLPENHLLYKGFSMKMVFVPGDLLVVRDIAISEVRQGDIVAFQRAGAADGIVHRVLKINSDCLVTMGDNNSAPDRFRVTAAERPRLVLFRVDANGRQHGVSRGAMGMALFRWHRVRYWTRRILSKIYRVFFPR